MADPTPADAKEAAQASAAQPPAGKKKLLIIIAAAVLALALAGGGTYFFLSRGADETHEADGAQEGEVAGKKGKGAGKKAQQEAAASKGPPIYVEFDPPFVVNFEAKGLVRFLQVSVQAMTRDAHTAELLKLHDPKLRNDLLMLFGSQTYETISTRAGKEQLRSEARQTIAKVVVAEGGKDKSVEEVYFTSFVMQ